MSGKEGRTYGFGAILCAMVVAFSSGGAFGGVIFEDDFEGPTLRTGDTPPGKWAWMDEDGGTVSLVSSGSPVFDGSQSVLLDNSMSTDTVSVVSPGWVLVNEAYFKVYMLITGAVWGDYQGVIRVYGTDDLFRLRVRASDKLLRILYGPGADSSGGGSYDYYAGGTGTTPIQEDRWYCIEMYYHHCTGPGDTTGEITVWLDGVQEISLTGLDTSDGSAVQQIDHWAIGYARAAFTGEVYFDNVSVSDTRDISAFELISPNGGELWVIGNSAAVSWFPGSAGPATVDIQLTRDGTWASPETIATGTANDGSFSWPVTGSASTNCLVRIRDGAVTLDESNGSFSITGASMTLTSPIGGETLVPGKAHEVTWDSTVSGNVDILLSTDSGGTFTTYLATNTDGGGSIYVRVPDLGADVTTCRIRVQETGGAGLMDDSDSDFTISVFSSTTIFQNGFEEGQLLVGDGGVWDSSSVSGGTFVGVTDVRAYTDTYAGMIDWYTTTGSSWVTFDKDLGDTYGEVYWKFYVYLDEIDGTRYELFKLRNESGGEIFQALYRPDSGDIISFNAGGSVIGNWAAYGTSDAAHPLTPGQWHSIIFYYRVSTYDQSDGIIRCWLNGELIYEKTDMDDQGNGTEKPSCIRWIRFGGDGYGTGTYGGKPYFDDVEVSNDLRLPSALTILTPSAGMEWAVGSDVDITWIPGDVVAIPNVRIELSRNDGANWEDLTVSTPNDGSFTWNVLQGPMPLPQFPCLVRISDEVDGDPVCTSGQFSITGASITVTNPAGGEEWGVDSAKTIEWTTQGSIAMVDVQLSRDGGTTWGDLAASIPNSGSYVWTVADGGETLPQTCVIRVRDTGSPGTYDDSGSFTIAAALITVTYPVGGESWAGGSAQRIDWTSNLGPEVTLEIALSYNGGETYRVLTMNSPNDGTSFFGVPDHPTDNQAMIRVSFGTASSESGVFSITPQSYNWLFQDGFETGVPGVWDSQTVQDNCELNAVTSPAPHSGTNSLEVVVDNVGSGLDSTNARLRETVAAAGTAVICTRFYAMMESPAALHWSFNLLNYLGDGGSHISEFFFHADTGELRQNRAPDADPTGGWVSDLVNPGTFPADSAWHEMGLYYKPSTVDGAADGVFRFYFDGAFVEEAGGLDTRPNSGGSVHSVTGIDLAGWMGRDNNMQATAYFDDINVCNGDIYGPFVVMIAADGGEEWVVGNTEDITWHVTDNVLLDITHVDIEISRNNGTSWTSVVSNVDVATLTYDATWDTYSHSWDVDNGGLPTPQDLCLIRITDVTAGNPGNSGVSDSNFTIGDANTHVVTPNGGEVWGIGTDQDITWTSFGVDTVEIRVSYNNGGNWNAVTIVMASDLSYTWPVSGGPSAVCLIEVRDAVTTTVSDESDAVFTIINPTVSVTYPNGGETVNVGDTMDITWNSQALVNVHIELSRNSGTTWEDIVASTDASTGIYAWTVTGPLSANCVVRISDLDDDPFDVSNADFAIEGVYVTSPVGGESWDVTSSATITWQAAGVTNVDIELSRDDGGTWEVVATTVDATLGTYGWTVTGPGSALCIVRISESTTGSPSDQSAGVFTIAGIEVTYPNGGETWNLNENVSILWNSAGVTNVHVELSRDNGTSWEDIAASTDATVGSYAWTVSVPSSVICLVRVSDLDAVPSDVSDAVFEIVAPQITVTSPTTGDAWAVGSSHDITWTAPGVNDVMIDISRDGGTTWEEIVDTTSAFVAYTWTSVTGLPSATCIIRVRDILNPWTIYGDSDTFTISGISVTAPAAGDTWCCEGDTQDIIWTSVGITSNVDIAYSIDGGITWTDSVLNEPDDGSFTWTIPNADSTNCMVRVEETGGGGAVGLSEVFTLTPASIAVTLPVTGSSWGLATAQTITWNSVGLANVMIELSRDGNWVNGDGSDVDTIVASTDATAGTYTWGSVTGPESTNCLVRISDANDGTPAGVSGTFIIATSSLALTSPNGGEVWSIGKTARTRWDQVGVATLDIALSTDGGVTWTDIVIGTDGQQGYCDWTVTGAAFEDCLVRISSGTLNDTSAGTFWIINANGDTDGDGFTDQEEVDGGTNPFDKKDKPPVMFHGKTGCGAAVDGSLLSALLTALAGMCVLKRKK